MPSRSSAVLEWDLPRQAGQLAAAKMVDDREQNKVVREDGTAICRRCGLDWDKYVHAC